MLSPSSSFLLFFSLLSSFPFKEIMAMTVFLEFDGASKGNPGKAGAGAVIKSEDDSVLAIVREGMGIDTNNAAEYRALIRGMKTALEMGYDRIYAKGDSQLVCKQMQGEWQTSNPNMARYFQEAMGLKRQFRSFYIEHVPRALNRDADAEANLAANLPAGYVEKDIGGRITGGYY